MRSPGPPLRAETVGLPDRSGRQRARSPIAAGVTTEDPDIIEDPLVEADIHPMQATGAWHVSDGGAETIRAGGHHHARAGFRPAADGVQGDPGLARSLDRGHDVVVPLAHVSVAHQDDEPLALRAAKRRGSPAGRGP